MIHDFQEANREYNFRFNKLNHVRTVTLFQDKSGKVTYMEASHT